MLCVLTWEKMFHISRYLFFPLFTQELNLPKTELYFFSDKITKIWCHCDCSPITWENLSTVTPHHLLTFGYSDCPSPVKIWVEGPYLSLFCGGQVFTIYAIFELLLLRHAIFFRRAILSFWRGWCSLYIQIYVNILLKLGIAVDNFNVLHTYM